jgi:hypothetical protein
VANGIINNLKYRYGRLFVKLVGALMAAFCLGASFGYAVLAETDVPPEGQDWSTLPSGANLSPGAQATDETAPANPFDDASAMTTLVDQQAEQNTETVAQEVEEMLWPEFGAYNDTYEGLAAFWGDDIISNFFANIGQLLGKWLSELINGWVADAVQLLTGFLRIFVLNPNIAVNGLSSVPGGPGQPVDDISPYVRQGADVMYGIAVDLLLLLFILCIWKYWAEAAWRGGGNLMGAVGRLIFTAGLMLAWPTIYAFEIQITNEMIKTIYFNSADQVAMLDAAMAAAVKGGLVAGAGLLANATAPVAGQVLGGILAGGPGGLVLGTVGSIVAFAGLIIYLILGGVLIAQLVYILVLKAIQTALLTAQYMFAPIFLVFFAVPDTENVTSGFVRSFVEVSLWTFVWVGLLKIMVIIILSDFNPWGKLIVAIGVLQIMIQVPSFLARAQISPMSDFISAGLITGGLLGAGKALGNSLGHRAMHFANAVGNYSYGGAKGSPKSQAAELRGLGNDVMNPELLSGIRETQKTGKVPGQKKGPGEGGIPTDANGQPLKPIDPNAKKPGDPNAKKPGDPNATAGAGKNLNAANGLGPGLNAKIDPLTGKPIGAGAGDGTGAGVGVGANVANASLKPAGNTGFSGKIDPATGQMVGGDGKPLAGGGFGGAVSSFAAGGLMAAGNAATLGNPTKTGDENKIGLNGGDPTKGLNPAASPAKLNDPNNKVGAQDDKTVKTTVGGGDKNAAANLAPAATASVTGKVNDKGEGKATGKSAVATDGKGKDLLPGFNAANIGAAMAGMNLGSTPGAKEGGSEVEVEFDKEGNPLNAAVGKGAVTGLNGLKPDSKGGVGSTGGNATNQKQTLAGGKTDGANLSAAQGAGDTKLTTKQPGVSPVSQKSVIPPLASTGLANFASATATGKVLDPTVALATGDDTLVSGDPGEPLGSTAKTLQAGSLGKTGSGRNNNGISAKIDPVTGKATSVAANANLNNATSEVSGRVVSGTGNVTQPGVGAGNVNQFNFAGSALPATASGAGMVGLGQTGATNVSGIAEFSAEDGNVAGNAINTGAPGFNAANIAGGLAQSVARVGNMQTGGIQNAGFTAKIDPVTGKATSVAANANLNNATADVSGRMVSGSGNTTQPGVGAGNVNAGGNANQFNFAGSALPTTAGGAGMVGLGQTGATNVSGIAEFSAEDGNVAGNAINTGAPGFNAANIAGGLAQSVARVGNMQTGGIQNAGFTAKIDPVTGKATSVAANANLNNATADVSGRMVSGSGNTTQPGVGAGNVNAGGNANQFNFAGSAIPATAGGVGMVGLGQTGATNVSGTAEFSAEDGNVAGNAVNGGAAGFNAANIAGGLAQSVARTAGMQTGGVLNASFTAKIDPSTGKATSVGPAATLGNVDATMRGGNSSSPAANNNAQQVGGQFNFAGSVPGINNGQVNPTNFSAVVEGIGGNDSITQSAALNPGSLASAVGQLSSKGNQQQAGGTGASFRATIDNGTGRSTSVNGTSTIDATSQNNSVGAGVGSGSQQINSQFSASNSGSGTPNIPPVNTTIGGGDMGGGDDGNGSLNASAAAPTAGGPRASTFANRMQSGYIQVPGRGAAAAMRMAEGGSLMQSDTGVPTNVYDTHGHLMQVRVGQGASDEQISMQILSGAFGELMSTDAAAYDAARQSAIDAGEHKPQGLAERAASGIMAYNGGSWSQTAAAKQRFARSMAKHASLGAQAYVSGGEGNAYTEYLNNRYGVMDEDQQAWAVHLMTDDSSPESGFSWKNKPASDGLIQSGVGISSVSRAVAANNSVMKAQPWLKGAGIRGGVEYMQAMGRDVIPEGTPGGIKDAWYGSVAQDVPAEVANTWGALTLAMGEQVCAEYQTVDTVAAMVGPNGRPEDYVGAYHALKGGEEAVKRVSARFGDTRVASGGSQSVSMSGGSSYGGSQEVASSGPVQTSVSSTSLGAPANSQSDVDFFLDGPQVSAAPVNPGSLSVPNLNNPHSGATIANVRMQQGNASSGGVQNTSVRMPGSNVGSSQGQVQIGSVQGGGDSGGNLSDQQVLVDVDTSVSGQVIDPGSVQSAALQSAIGQFGSSGNMVQQVVADLRASGMNWNQIIDANRDDGDPGKYAFLETAVQAYSQNSASMPAVAAAANAVGPSKVSMQDVEIVQNMIDSDPRWDARSIDSSSVYTAKAIVQAHYQEPQTYGQPVLTKDYVDSIRTDPRFIPRPLPVRDSQGSVVRHDQTPVPKDRLMRRILEQALGRDSFGGRRA